MEFSQKSSPKFRLLRTRLKYVTVDHNFLLYENECDFFNVSDRFSVHYQPTCKWSGTVKDCNDGFDETKDWNTIFIKLFLFLVNLYNSVSLRNYRPIHLSNSSHNLNSNVVGQNYHHSQVISLPEIQYIQSEDCELINTSILIF